MVGITYSVFMELHERIRAARKASGLKQHEVADHFGIKPVSVTQWESGKTRPDQEKIPRLAKLFGVNLAWLMEEAGHREFKPILNGGYLGTHQTRSLTKSKNHEKQKSFPSLRILRRGATPSLRLP